MLVAAEEPLLRFIPCLLEEPFYRLVLNGQELNGIVTRSDLLKLPVRLLAFARVNYLEMILADLISAHYRGDSWLEHLDDSQREKINRYYNRLRKKRINLTKLEVSDFGHKYTVASYLPGFTDDFINDMKGLKDLRDVLAHPKDFIENEKALQDFWERLQKIDYWIGELSSRAANIPSGENNDFR